MDRADDAPRRNHPRSFVPQRACAGEWVRPRVRNRAWQRIAVPLAFARRFVELDGPTRQSCGNTRNEQRRGCGVTWDARGCFRKYSRGHCAVRVQRHGRAAGRTHVAKQRRSQPLRVGGMLSWFSDDGRVLGRSKFGPAAALAFRWRSLGAVGAGRPPVACRGPRQFRDQLRFRQPHNQPVCNNGGYACDALVSDRRCKRVRAVASEPMARRRGCRSRGAQSLGAGHIRGRPGRSPARWAAGALALRRFVAVACEIQLGIGRGRCWRRIRGRRNSRLSASSRA